MNRANRAHLNAVENLGPFAAVVVVAHFAGLSSPVTQACAAIYFYARLVHAVVHISGFGLFMARTVTFSIGWTAFIVYAAWVLKKVL